MVVIDYCSECDCDKKRVIVNKTRYLCKEKNHLRLHGETEQETLNKKAQKWSFGQKKKSLKSISKKESLNKEKYSETIFWLKENVPLECSGCGQNQFLSPSHLVRRSDRKDLESNKNNIKWHCMERLIPDKFGNMGCHDRWESLDIEKMLSMKDFEENLKIVKSLDNKLFNRINFLLEKL